MKPIICSFYTVEYTHLAMKMQKSAESFGLNTKIVKIDKINGRWIDTILFRPKFIKAALEHFKQDVVWLDCDAIIEKEPSVLYSFEGDFGIHVHDFPWKKKEHLGGTMYFSYNERTFKFLDNWIGIAQTYPTPKLSQEHIPIAIEQTPELIVMQLPASYCQIFDHMQDCGEPVISHWQASRKYRT